MDTLNLNFSLLLENMKMEVRFDYFNASRNVKPSSFSFHSHTVYEVYFIESGEMSLCFGDRDVQLKTHDILIISPNTPHRVKECSETLKRFNLRFLLNAQAGLAAIPNCFLFRPKDKIRAEIFQNIEKIYLHVPDIKHQWEFFRIKSYFGIIISYIVEAIIPTQKPVASEIADTAYGKSKIDLCIRLDRFFDENYALPIKIDDLAKELHYSKTHVNRLLKHFWGISFSEKLSQTRLYAAKRYLITSTYTVSEISERCGYSTLRGFELFFEKHVGMLPKEYRKINAYVDESSVQ